MVRHLSCFLLLLQSIMLHAQVKTYAEMYRPQFHPSASSGFMGDPNGPIKFQGKYHLFWWGHMRSDDLVYWEEINKNALHGTPPGFGNWSGSVVVDTNNTSGFSANGISPMIAVYTLHEDRTGFQRQAISYSLNYGSFKYYSGNPVINSTSHDFRDPQVFWHVETAKWIMVITKSVDRAIEIYSSVDLKSWVYESTFSDRGAKKEVWEVPDLFELTLNGNSQNKKWVMTCGMGPNRMQFWVGHFDGHQFTLDPEENLLTGDHVSGELFADFENLFDGWIVEGDAFGSAPATETLPNQQTVNGYTGNGYVSSFHSGDVSTGRMISEEFVITKRFLNCQIAGGANTTTRLSVVVDGVEIAYVSSPTNRESFSWRGVDLSGSIGKIAHIEIIDEASGSWGHILVDQIVFSDVLFDTRVENANWADWGLDFYAAKSFRNYDNDDTRKIWLAWMGNWVYAKNLPTKPWQGFQCLPRELSLIKDEQGYQLVQKPIAEFEKLRLTGLSKTSFSVTGTQSFDFNPEWNVYELKAKFKVRDTAQVFGFNLAESDDQKIEVSYDAKTSNLMVTRPHTHFSYGGFSRQTKAPIVLSPDSILDLHIFLDQSSIEIFANGYKTTISSVAFTNVNETGVSLFSKEGSVEVVELQAWPLKSIWEITADEMEKPVEEHVTGIEKKIETLSVFPNPVKPGQEIHLDLSDGVHTVRLFNAIGQQHFVKKASESDMRIPEWLAKGPYFLCIHTDNKTETIKIIVE